MPKAVSFKRFDNENNKSTDADKQNALIEQWAKSKNVVIVRSFEAICHPDNVFETKEWIELETFVVENAIKIDNIITPKFLTLCKENFHAILEKAEFFSELGVKIILASEE